MARRRSFASLAPQIERELGAAVLTAAQMIQVAAQISITTGAVSGRNHVPSRPGEPPNNNWGTLANNIEAVQTGPLEAEVSSNAPYAVALEYGTSRMAERPYMRPARDKMKPEIRKLMAQALKRATARAGGR